MKPSILAKAAAKREYDSTGIAAYYAKHIHFLNSILQKHHKKMMFWGDIALQHEEILDLLPNDLIWLSWEYGTPAQLRTVDTSLQQTRTALSWFVRVSSIPTVFFPIMQWP